MSSLARLQPGEQEQGALGVEEGAPGLEADIQSLPRNSEEMSQEVLAPPAPQVRMDLANQFVPQGSVGPRQKRPGRASEPARPAGRRDPIGRIHGGPIQAFNRV